MANVDAAIADVTDRTYGITARIDNLEQRIAEVLGTYWNRASFEEMKSVMAEEITSRVIDEVTNTIMKKIEDCVLELNQKSLDKEFITDIERLLLACQQ